MDEPVKQTKDNSKFGNLPGPGPGRPEGSVNRTTRLKHAILDGLAKAAINANYEDSAAYIAAMMESPLDRVAILRIGASLIPKVLKAEVTERVIITMGPDEDCGGDSVPGGEIIDPGATEG